MGWQSDWESFWRASSSQGLDSPLMKSTLVTIWMPHAALACDGDMRQEDYAISDMMMDKSRKWEMYEIP